MHYHKDKLAVTVKLEGGMVSWPAPIMLKILPIILSRISQKFCPSFFCSLPTYYSNDILLTILHAGT